VKRIFSLLPKGVIAFLAIVGGIAYIIISSPPHTVCDSQIEVFRKTQQSFLFLNPKKKGIKTTKYEILRDNCKATNNPGGCYELFQELKTMNRDLETLPKECSSAVGSVTEVKRAIWESAELMVALAWGEKPPSTYYSKFGWLDRADISLFCSLKARATGLFGESQWNSFRERVFKTLPGAAEMARNQIWDMSILSENCTRYP
jgi:hypothetical protein